MKKSIRSTFLVLLAALSLSGTSACTKVPAGSVGVKVYLLGSDKGVDHEVLDPGRYYIGYNEDLFLFPTFQQNYTWTKSAHEGSPNDESITFQTSEGLSVNGDFGISYTIDKSKVSNLFQKYRRNVEEITDTYLRNMVRDSLNTHASNLPIESVYGKGKTDLMVMVDKDVRDWTKDVGIIVDRVYLIGEFRLPRVVEDSLNAKIAATQMAQQRENEVAQAKAEAQKEVEVARGQAMSNELKSKSLTPELLEYQSMLNQQDWIKKWDGKQPQVSLGTGSVLPTFAVPAPALAPKNQ